MLVKQSLIRVKDGWYNKQTLDFGLLCLGGVEDQKEALNNTTGSLGIEEESMGTE
jgi:hypothetical protein